METNKKNEVESQCWWQYLSEEEFQSTFRISRKTLVDLQAEIDYLENLHQDRIETGLLVCLWFLGSVKPLDTANKLFNIDNAATAIKEYLVKLLKLASLYIVWPAPEEANVIESGFISHYKFPSIIGVIGSLYIEVEVQNVPNKRFYFNKLMQKNTIVLQVVCDHNLLLRNVCVGCPGGNEIKSILKSSPLYKVLASDDALVKNNHHLLGGTEHPQLNTLLTPFETVKNLTDSQYNFNVMHSNVMSCMESTFRCMENRFPRLTSVDDLNPELAGSVVGSICVLHNFTRIRNDNCELYS